MVAARFSSDDSNRVEPAGSDRTHDLDDWVAELRRVALDNLRKNEKDDGGVTLRARLFPLNRGDALRLRDVLYSESLWAAGTLVACFLAYILTTGNWSGAVAFVLLTSLLLVPLLALWAGLGYFYARKSARRARSGPPS
jgi:hypothetical protein